MRERYVSFAPTDQDDTVSGGPRVGCVAGSREPVLSGARASGLLARRKQVGKGGLLVLFTDQSSCD